VLYGLSVNVKVEGVGYIKVYHTGKGILNLIRWYRKKQALRQFMCERLSKSIVVEVE